MFMAMLRTSLGQGKDRLWTDFLALFCLLLYLGLNENPTIKQKGFTIQLILYLKSFSTRFSSKISSLLRVKVAKVYDKAQPNLG